MSLAVSYHYSTSRGRRWAWCACERVPDGQNSNALLRTILHALTASQLVLKGWILEVLYCDPTESRAFLRGVFFGRVMCLLMLGSFKTQGLLHSRAGPMRSFDANRRESGLFCGSFPQKDEVLASGGLIYMIHVLKFLSCFVGRAKCSPVLSETKT
jgi:hypothetical protein